jgi:hypothetical protein
MVDTLKTASAFGLRVRPKVCRNPVLEMEIDFDPCRQENFDALVAAWLPLTYAVNGLNHSMGQQDLYIPLSWPRRSWVSSASSTDSSVATVARSELRTQDLVSLVEYSVLVLLWVSLAELGQLENDCRKKAK